MSEEEKDIPQITTRILGITDEIDIDINKLASMVEGWCKEYNDTHKIEVQEMLDTQDESISKILKDFNGTVLKYLKVGLIASINFGLIGFGWFLNTILA